MAPLPEPTGGTRGLALRLAGGGLWWGVGALALWSAAPSPWLLLVAAAGLGAAPFAAPRGGWLPAAVVVVLVLGVAGGFAAHHEAAGITGDWSAYWERRETAVGERLDAELEARLSAAEGAAAALAAMAADSVPTTARPLRRLRRTHDVTALALYGPSGELLAWDGTHRGLVPDEVQRGLRRYAFGDLPLFGHLYVTAPAGSGVTAVAAVLLRADLPGALAAGAEDWATRFRRRVGEPVRLIEPAADESAPGWDWKLGERTLFTVVLDAPDPTERRSARLGAWQLRVGGAALAAGLLLVRMAGGGGWGASALLVLLAALLPFDRLAGLAPIFDPGTYALPGPLPLSLGRVSALVLALLPAAVTLPPLRRPLPAIPIALGGAVAVAALLLGLGAGFGAEALAAGKSVWLVHQGVAALLATVVFGMVLGAARAGRSAGPWGWFAVPSALALGAAGAWWVWRTGAPPAWWPLLWAAPLAMAGAWGAPWPGARTALATWMAAGVLAGSATLPAAWGERVQARREVAEAHLARMAASEDPALEDALRRLASDASRLEARGADGVGLLYEAWRGSGMADLGAPAWLTLWSPGGVPEEELRVGVVERPVVSYEVQEDAGHEGGTRILRYDRDDARYVLRHSLPGGRILTVAAPPFVDPAFRSGLSPLLGGAGVDEPPPVTLIPLAAWEGAREGVRWIRTSEGWRADRPLSFSNALYQGQYLVSLPAPVLAAARATLLLVGHLVLLLILRAVGLALAGGWAPRRPRFGDFVISFRGRVTLALFGFFVLAVALFGTLAYRTIAGGSWRAAQVLAERVAEDAAGWYIEVSGRMQALSRRVGVELLEYRSGELRDGSVEELVALGLYEAWLPMEVSRSLERRQDLRGVVHASLGSWEYVSAFRRLPDGDVVAVQIPRQAGASAIRAGDVLELLAFAVLIGAALSLGLALLVARALTSPIHALQVASERVGAGNLAVALPADRPDEFGSVFLAFNRMVDRLRRARRQLVRTTRRTQAIMEEAAVGMVALDPNGRVTLANPRAGQLLGADVARGASLPSAGALGSELRAWLEAFLASRRQEATVELADGGRRIRVRARRIGGGASPRGAVVALEDVTDELHTERVLAWGEMARQVAHEVKNPLTPMKLSVQHVRRAWDDRRPDFEAILYRNVDAILEEIDRLAAIAKSFSRFGAPREGGEIPLEPVDLGRVVADVLALYRGSEGPVSFGGALPDGLPLVRARVPEMKEVLVNLLENARSASPPGSRVEVAAEAGPGGGVLLHIADEGRGIPEALRARVFEPQFSTRSTGAGLGLAIVRRLVESWGGTVGLESREGAGTRVTVHLSGWEGEAHQGGSMAARDGAF